MLAVQKVLLAAAALSVLAVATPLSQREAPPDNEPAKGVYQIHALQRDYLCLGSKTPEPKHGDLIGIVYCKEGGYSKNNIINWESTMDYASGNFRLNGTDLCMDGGDQSNGVPLTLANCSESDSQKLGFNSKTQVVLNSGEQCLDVQAESQPTLEKWYPVIRDVQIWACMTGNMNQVFRWTNMTAT